MDRENRFVALDGLRGIAAICVVALHVSVSFDKSAYFPHAHLAVDFFFMLSAFVIANAYAVRMANGMTFRRFLAIRWIRLFPLYFAGLMLGIFVYLLQVQSFTLDGIALAKVILAALFFLPSSQDLGHGWGSSFPLNGPAWSLFWEWVGNIAWALVLTRLGKTSLIVLTVAAGILYCTQALLNDMVNQGHPIRLAFPYLAGLVLWSRKAERYDVGTTLEPLALAVLLLTLLNLPSDVFGISRGGYEAAAACIGFPAVIAWGSRIRLQRRTTTAAVWLGGISSPIYILHMPIVRLFAEPATRLGHGYAYWIPLTVLAEVLFVLAFAYSMLRIWDIPIRGYLSRRFSAQPTNVTDPSASERPLRETSNKCVSLGQTPANPS
jgi:peptidoglycan/LPS O-acetylase OafA/YrhL